MHCVRGSVRVHVDIFVLANKELGHFHIESANYQMQTY